VIGLVVPPLRERKEDLPLLAFHFLEKYNREIGKKIGQISPEAMRLLFEYEWPGNVRELENIIERAVIFAKERFISEKDLPEELRGGLAVPLPYDLRGKSLKETLEEVEKSLIVQILREAHGNQSEAAKKLGINRTTLISKLKKYHLNLQDRLEG
jgi:transcriptional regulator with PAS, ATPase and Fis domain